MLLGSEMERMSDPARAQVVEQIHVFARVSPAQKNRIILAMKSRHEEPISPFERYSRLEEEYQDVLRGELIFGLHVHVGIASHAMAATLMNQARSWLPHLLALSTNAPFWAGRLTGLKSFRF